MTINPRLLEAIDGSHLHRVASWIADYLGTGCDFVSLMLFLSRAAGRLGIPLNVVVTTDEPTAVRMIVDSLLHCSPANAATADRLLEFRCLLEQGCNCAEVVLVRSLHRQLLSFALEAVSQDPRSTRRIPSLWWIDDKPPPCTVTGATIQIIATSSDLCLSGFGHYFSRKEFAVISADRVDPKANLEHLLSHLSGGSRFDVPFQHSLRAQLRPEEMLVVNRLMLTIAALRLSSSQSSNLITVDLEDFALARGLLQRLPVAAAHDRLPAYALQTATAIWERVYSENYQLTVPDHSELGNKVFTRQRVIEWTELSYNAVKDHLRSLEDAGIIEATCRLADRRQGNQVYYTFTNGTVVPFLPRNPYLNLPTADQIAVDCRSQAQS